MGQFYKKGLQFSCTQCGYCCSEEPGFVFLSEDDLKALSNHLSLTQDQFIEQYCRIVNMGTFSLISLTEKKNHDCIFFESGCTVYEARPVQCSTYPFWASVVDSKESWEEESERCPGIGKRKRYSSEEIEQLLLARRINKPLEM